MDTYFNASKGLVDESRGISGGRYGCAQFLQVCGTPLLKTCSLGKLVYLVQLAINEDLFRYQKTLLVWNPPKIRKFPDELASLKLQSVQRAVVELLGNARNGISLAQLPLHLNKKLGFQFDVTEFGFPKLKDLLTTFPNVEVEMKAINHPFAKLRAHWEGTREVGKYSPETKKGFTEEDYDTRK